MLYSRSRSSVSQKFRNYHNKWRFWLLSRPACLWPWALVSDSIPTFIHSKSTILVAIEMIAIKCGRAKKGLKLGNFMSYTSELFLMFGVLPRGQVSIVFHWLFAALEIVYLRSKQLAKQLTDDAAAEERRLSTTLVRMTSFQIFWKIPYNPLHMELTSAA